MTTRISGHSSMPVKLLRRSQSAKSGASPGCGGVKIYDAPTFGTYTRKSNNIKYIIQDTSCNCCKKSFLEKFIEGASCVIAALVTGKSMVDIFSQIFGKKNNATEPETPVTPQQPTVSEKTKTEESVVNNNKTYYGGMLGEVTVNGRKGTVETGTNYTTNDFTGNISQTAAELVEQYAAISNIEITGDEGSYQAKITYNGTDGKTVSKDVTVADTNALVTEVKNLMQELQKLDNDVGKAAQQIKQMYAGIISDIEVTQNDDGTYSAKITVPNTLKKAGGTAVKTVKVSSSKELDKAVSDFTAELLTTEENNPFKAYNNFLSEINGASKQTNIENIDDLVKSQMALMDTDEDGYISDKEMLDYESATNKIETEERIKENVTLQFNVFDTSRDGQVSSDELKQFYQDAAGEDNILTASEYDTAIKQGLSKLEDQMPAEILKQNDKPPVDAPQGPPPPKGNKKPKTQESADIYVNAFKNGTFTDSKKIGNQYVDYKDGQFRIADNWNMEKCKPVLEEEVKNLYMGS